MVAPDGIIGCVDYTIAISVAVNERERRRAAGKAIPPHVEIKRAHRAVQVIVAGYKGCGAGPPGEREIGGQAAAVVNDFEFVIARMAIRGKRNVQMLEIVGGGN